MASASAFADVYAMTPAAVAKTSRTTCSETSLHVFLATTNHHHHWTKSRRVPLSRSSQWTVQACWVLANRQAEARAAFEGLFENGPTTSRSPSRAFT